jgi:GT2 family glycosyltransferase
MSANVRSQINGSYTTIYSFLVGGVLTIRPKTFVALNGYSNRYFNWGGEDDDMGLRFLSKDICVQRPTNGYYYATSHSSQTRNKNRFKLLFDAVLRQDIDGLNNIDKLAAIENVYEYSLVTWMTVKWIDNSLLPS